MNHQFRKRLFKYIEQKKRTGVPLDVIKALFLKRGYSHKQTKVIFLGYYLRRFFGLGVSLILAMGLFGTLFLYSNSKDTTLAQNSPLVIDEIAREFIGSSEFNWTPKEEEGIYSLKASGSINRNSSAKIVLVASEKEYLLFDSSLLEEEPIPHQENVSIGTTNDSAIEFILSADRTIAPLDEPIVISVTSPSVSENMSQEKLCTVYTMEDSACYGSPECCSFVESSHEEKFWNDTFYLTIGKLGSSPSGNISVHIAYVDFNLSSENTYSNTLISDPLSMPIGFFNERIYFEDRCLQTCQLPELTEDSYLLKIEANDSVFIEYLSYATIPERVNSAPLLIGNFSNVSLEQGQSIVYNLSHFFMDPENDSLVFSHYNSLNLKIQIENETAIISANESFLGVDFVFFLASDGEFATASNVFSVTIVEKPKPLQIIGEGLKSLRELIGI